MTVRPFAQLAGLLFLVVGIAGFFLGDAGSTSTNVFCSAQVPSACSTAGIASGNFDGVALHLTYLHDVINLVIGAALIYAGWRADARTARLITYIVGGVLIALAIIGFALSDDDAGTRSVVTLHFPIAINILDLVAGTLAVLCALGDTEASPAQG